MKKLIVLILAVCIASVAQAGSDKKKSSSDWDMERFMQSQHKYAEKHGKEFDRAKSEAKFAKKDTNGDGILTKEERQASQQKNQQKK